jgi:hypothetical protein
MFHRLEDTIQAHLTIVFTALAVSRETQARAGLSINKVFKVLRPLRSATPSAPSKWPRSPASPPTPGPSSTTSAGVVTKPLQLRPGAWRLAEGGVCPITAWMASL